MKNCLAARTVHVKPEGNNAHLQLGKKKYNAITSQMRMPAPNIMQHSIQQIFLIVFIIHHCKLHVACYILYFMIPLIVTSVYPSKTEVRQLQVVGNCIS